MAKLYEQMEPTEFAHAIVGRKSVRATKSQGMNWIRQEKRLAIYLRDGCACGWCGAKAEDGAQLTLDHIVPYVKGGSHHEANLVTSCHRCNSARGKRSLPAFAQATAVYLNHGLTMEAILANIRRLARRSLTPHKAEAKELIARRGSVFNVLTPAKEQ